MDSQRKVLKDLLADVEENNSSLSLLGTQVHSPADLAKVAEVLRSPRYETFHYLFTKKGIVKGTTAVSCRLAGSTMIFAGSDKDEFSHDLLQRAKGVEADTFYFLHNHPSGDPTPSHQDRHVTEVLVKEIQKDSDMHFGGHVIINSRQYAVINSLGMSQSHFIDYDSYDVQDMRKGSSFFNTQIKCPQDFAVCAKQLQKDESSFYMLGLNTRNSCNSLYQMSYDVFDNDKNQLKEAVKNWAFTSGVHYFGLLNFQTEKIKNAHLPSLLNFLGESGYILDILDPGGNSLRSSGVYRHSRAKMKKEPQQIHDYSNEYETPPDSKEYSTPLKEWLSKQDLSALGKKVRLGIREHQRLRTFVSGVTADLPIKLLWKLDPELHSANISINDSEVQREESTADLIEAHQRAISAVQRNYNPRNASDPVSQTMVEDMHKLSGYLHGKTHKGLTWDHSQGLYVMGAYIPPLQIKKSLLPTARHIKELIQKYTPSIQTETEANNNQNRKSIRI